MLVDVEWPEILSSIDDGKQARIADQVGVTQQAVSGWFTLTAFPDRDNVEVIAGLLDVNIDELEAAVHRALHRPRPQRPTAQWRAEVDLRLERIEEMVTELAEVRREAERRARRKPRPEAT